MSDQMLFLKLAKGLGLAGSELAARANASTNPEKIVRLERRSIILLDLQKAAHFAAKVTDSDV